MRTHSTSDHEITIDDIVFVIVLYGTKLNDSVTFKSLKDCVHIHNFTNVNLLVYDNGPMSEAISKDFYFDEFKIKYVLNDQNYGVSYCYNQAAIIADKKKKKYIILLDQDTFMPQNSLSIYISSMNKWKNFPVYVPKLISNNTLFSPCHYKFYRASHIQGNLSSGVYEMFGKNVLNSGLAVSVPAFIRAGGYEESVRLYFSDFVFFNKLKNFYKYFIVMDCILEHNLSSVDYTDSTEALKRFKLYVDGAISAEKVDSRPVVSFLYFINILGRSVLMSIRLKNFKFLSVFIKAYTV